MFPHNMPPEALEQIQKLVEANFAGRDELNAAAASIDDDRRKAIVRQLADHLADHAIELQQIVTANGQKAWVPESIYSIAGALFDLITANRGPDGVIAAAERCEQNVVQAYDKAIAATQDPDTEGMLRRQRDEAEFGKNVLHCMSELLPDESATDE